MTQDVLARVKRATKERQLAQTEWRASIRAAVHSGETLRAVADVADISHVRVLQITRSSQDGRPDELTPTHRSDAAL